MLTDQSHLIAHNPPLHHYGIAVSDINSDGAPEFLVCGYGSDNRILQWANGMLRDVAPNIFADTDRMAVGIAAADLDGDGREEVYIVHADTFAGAKLHADRLFKLHDQRCEDLFSKPENRAIRNLVSGRAVATLDRRGNGRYGFLVSNNHQYSRFYEITNESKLADVAPSLGLNLVFGGRGVWVGPLTSERSEIVCVADGGPNRLLRQTQAGRFEDVTHLRNLLDESENGRGVCVLDADGDGRLDVAWCNWNGPHRLMLRQVDGSFRDRATPAFAMPSAARTIVVADFDNDGFEEIFFQNHGEPNRLFTQREGSWRLADSGDSLLPDQFGTGAAVADVDGDGRLELLLSHGEGEAQPLRLFKHPGPPRNWIRIQPRTRFGAPARGAVVRLVAGNRSQIRVIDGGSGFLCQMEPVAHFGLGSVEEVDSVRITWPDGASTTLSSPAIQQMHFLDYPLG